MQVFEINVAKSITLSSWVKLLFKVNCVVAYNRCSEECPLRDFHIKSVGQNWIIKTLNYVSHKSINCRNGAHYCLFSLQNWWKTQIQSQGHLPGMCYLIFLRISLRHVKRLVLWMAANLGGTYFTQHHYRVMWKERTSAITLNQVVWSPGIGLLKRNKKKKSQRRRKRKMWVGKREITVCESQCNTHTHTTLLTFGLCLSSFVFSVSYRFNELQHPGSQRHQHCFGLNTY